MLLQLKGQGFPEILSNLGVQSPLVGPFWQFESTVLPVLDVRKPYIQPTCLIPHNGFSSAGTINSPAADDFLATTSPANIPGFYALHLSWSWINTSPNNAIIELQRTNSTGTVVLENQTLAIVGGTTIGMDLVGVGTLDLVLFLPELTQIWGIRIRQALATAGSLVKGVIRLRFLGEIVGPSGFLTP